MKPMTLFKKIIGYEEIFTIAYRNIKKNDTCFQDDKTIKFRIWEDLSDYWYADPIIFEKDNFTYLFIEMFDRKKHKGVIGVSKFENGEFSKPQIIIEEAFHMSYPFVFEINNEIYMIPETSEVKKILFYKCTDLPLKWEKQTEIDTKELIVDTNVININNNYFLLSSLLESNLYKSRMHFEKLGFVNGKFSFNSSKELQYNSTVSFETRGAGRWFMLNEKILRPTQVSKNGLYGYSLRFMELEIDESHYKEQCLYELKPEKICFEFKKKEVTAIGTHTYARNDRLEVIDVKLMVFNKAKWLIRTKKYLYKKLNKIIKY